MCDGPQILTSTEVVNVRLIATIQTIAPDLIHAGAVYHDTGVVNENNLFISSRSPEDLPAFIQKSLLVLGR
ncbi:MAG: DJ-1/PfpI family protein [Acinetobacter sp.]|uniref:DJ-1/PfpI family protein n=1 Tax=unclassified Acinetobacter TaxID=196816 RepID=UPI0009D78427|nr:DJ-1/PfpI family protein [Acinetobacter sp. TTH0-4]